jgi:DNA-binding response OmpR family regulator
VQNACILWIEGRRAESPSFIPSVRKKGYYVDVVPTGTAALERLSGISPDLVVINAASMRTSGKRICRSLRTSIKNLPIILITSADQSAVEDTNATVVLHLPFTSRKLLNRIVRLLPGDGNKTLDAGPIHLDLELRRVKCKGREARLTPRLTQILEMLMRRHGEVEQREELFRKVWNTEYTGDTRTLDVHISWLRQAIEQDPRNPEYLKTIRGVGYRLDV